MGYATPYMGQTYVSKNKIVKHKGIYAKSIPPNGWCADLNAEPLENCEEYRLETARLEKLQQEQIAQKPYKRKSFYASPELRQEVYRRDKFNCYYCGRNISELRSKRIPYQLDHIVPRQMGGNESIDNLCFSCAPCNNAKKDDIWPRGCRTGYYVE